MHPETIRLIDYWLGVPLCALLTLWRRLLPARRGAKCARSCFSSSSSRAPVLAQDAIARATAWVGRDHVYFCVFDSNRAILEVLDTVPRSNIIVIRASSQQR